MVLMIFLNKNSLGVVTLFNALCFLKMHKYLHPLFMCATRIFFGFFCSTLDLFCNFIYNWGVVYPREIVLFILDGLNFTSFVIKLISQFFLCMETIYYHRHKIKSFRGGYPH